MNSKLNFGKHQGKSLEWLFFHDPGYVIWIHDNRIHEDQMKFSPENKERFELLVRRASNLKLPGTCRRCHKEPISRMFLASHFQGGIGHVDLLCETCTPFESTLSTCRVPTMLLPDLACRYDKLSQEIVLHCIRDAYFPDMRRLSQKRLEEFFDDPNNFVYN